MGILKIKFQLINPLLDCYNLRISIFSLGELMASCPDIDECEGNICLNNGVCNNLPGSFECICEPGFEGAICQHNIDDCSDGLCLNGGVCVDEVLGHRCDCNGTGYEGE